MLPSLVVFLFFEPLIEDFVGMVGQIKINGTAIEDKNVVYKFLYFFYRELSLSFEEPIKQFTSLWHDNLLISYLSLSNPNLILTRDR